MRAARLVAILLCGAAFAAQAAPLADPDAKTVRGIVQAQLAAFAADDAEKALALAVPGVRTQFASPDRFLAMVRAHYPMVHRPRSVTYLKPDSDGTMVFQPLRIADAAGGRWLVTYLLQQQTDRQWRISACLVKAETPRVQA
jgi:hypothetical protein